MKPTYVFILFLCFFALSLDSYGQCDDPSYFYIYEDGDGFGTMNYLSQNLTLAKQDWIDSGSSANFTSIAGNVAYGCDPPVRIGTLGSDYVPNNFDYNDSDPCITHQPPKGFYLDADGDGFG